MAGSAFPSNLAKVAETLRDMREHPTISNSELTVALDALACEQNTEIKQHAAFLRARVKDLSSIRTTEVQDELDGLIRAVQSVTTPPVEMSQGNVVGLLRKAIIQRDFANFEKILSSGLVDKNSIDEINSIHLVMSNFKEDERLEAVKRLLDFGADPNNAEVKNHQTPLHLAAEMNDKEIMQLLIKKGGDVNRQDSKGNLPIYFALHYSEPEVAQLLLPEVNLKVMEPKNVQALFKRAIERRNLGLFEKILNSNLINRDFINDDHLLIATLKSFHGDQCVIAVTLLLDFGADPNKLEFRPSMWGGYYYTPLDYVIRIMDEEMALKLARLFIEHDADVNPKDLEYRNLPLQCAVDSGKLKMAQFLLDAGADPTRCLPGLLENETGIRFLILKGARVTDAVIQEAERRLQIIPQSLSLRQILDYLKWHQAQQQTMSLQYLSALEVAKNLVPNPPQRPEGMEPLPHDMDEMVLQCLGYTREQIQDIWRAES